MNDLNHNPPDRFINKLVLATQKAAIASADYIGLGLQNEADKAAVEAMRDELNSINFKAQVSIGEGERDKAPMLHIGEILGKSSTKNVEFDIAVDPLEGTKLCANGGNGAMSVISISRQGSLLNAPDIYMNKLALSPCIPQDTISINNSIEMNLEKIQLAKKCNRNEITAVVLNRERHLEIISRIREYGARVRLIQDGDINAAISTSLCEEIDLYIGTGGAPEGVLAACALKSIGGSMQSKLVFKNKEEKNRAQSFGIYDFEKVYTIKEMVKFDAVFVATGVTDGLLTQGIKKTKNKLLTHSIVITNNLIQKINSQHINRNR